MRIALLVTLTALACFLPVAAADPVTIEVFTPAPDAVFKVSYTGTLASRCRPSIVVKTYEDLGTVRVPMTMNDKGVYEATAHLNRNGAYLLHLEGQDLRSGARLIDDNGGKKYGFEVLSDQEKTAREEALRKSALQQIKRVQTRFRNATVFFNNRQPSDARVAIVRSSDGRSVYRVRVENTGSRKVRVLEQVR